MKKAPNGAFFYGKDLSSLSASLNLGLNSKVELKSLRALSKSLLNLKANPLEKYADAKFGLWAITDVKYSIDKM
jgi:hypothetical protein